MENAKNELDKIREYESKGYTDSYQMDGDKLKSLENDKTYTVEEVTIHDQYRYEGMSDPMDNSILYAIETVDGGKGTLLIPYGPDGDNGLGRFMMKVTQRMESECAPE